MKGFVIYLFYRQVVTASSDGEVVIWNNKLSHPCNTFNVVQPPYTLLSVKHIMDDLICCCKLFLATCVLSSSDLIFKETSAKSHTNEGNIELWNPPTWMSLYLVIHRRRYWSINNNLHTGQSTTTETYNIWICHIFNAENLYNCYYVHRKRGKQQFTIRKGKLKIHSLEEEKKTARRRFLDTK